MTKGPIRPSTHISLRGSLTCTKKAHWADDGELVKSWQKRAKREESERGGGGGREGGGGEGEGRREGEREGQTCVHVCFIHT